MINLTTPLTSLIFEPALIGKCLISDDVIKINVQNAVALSLTSKMFYDCISESASFFEIFFQLVDPTNPLFIQNENSMLERLAKSKIVFRTKYFHLRNICLKKMETFPGTELGVALPREEGVEFVSFSKEITSCLLKQDLSYRSITIPEDIRRAPIQNARKSPLAACSEKFLAIKEPADSAIYVFKSDGEHFFAKYEVENTIQLEIQNDLLCIVELSLDNALNLYNANLVVFNLEDSEEQNPLKIPLLTCDNYYEEICFGKEYLIYTAVSEENQRLALPLSCLCGTENQRLALPLSCLRGDEIKWISGEKFSCQVEEGGRIIIGERFLLPKDDHFIEVVFTFFTECHVFKVNITPNGFSKKPIIENLRVTNDPGICQNICFHNDRIFFGYENPYNATEIIAYDMLSNTVLKVLTTPKKSIVGSLCKSKFLNVAANIYYLIVESEEVILKKDTFADHLRNAASNFYHLLVGGEDNVLEKKLRKITIKRINEVQIHLVTFTFGKV